MWLWKILLQWACIFKHLPLFSLQPFLSLMMKNWNPSRKFWEMFYHEPRSGARNILNMVYKIMRYDKKDCCMLCCNSRTSLAGGGLPFSGWVRSSDFSGNIQLICACIRSCHRDRGGHLWHSTVRNFWQKRRETIDEKHIVPPKKSSSPTLDWRNAKGNLQLSHTDLIATTCQDDTHYCGAIFHFSRYDVRGLLTLRSLQKKRTL